MRQRFESHGHLVTDMDSIKQPLRFSHGVMVERGLTVGDSLILLSSAPFLGQANAT